MNKKQIKARLKEIQARRKCINKIFTRGMVINFGKKWFGHRIDDVIKTDASWLQWCAEEGLVLFDDELYSDIAYEADLQREGGKYD